MLKKEHRSGNIKMNEKILIVDDDANIRESMHEFVQRAGYTVYSAEQAEKAIAFLKDIPLDVVITDIILPGMDGLELTDVVKNDYTANVIVMTGYSGEYSYEEAINKGAADFVFKPVRFEELLLRLKRVLKERELQRERERMLGKLQNLAITDGLTKLNNSRHFYHQLSAEVGRSNRYGHPMSLLLLDIDHFKDYNDQYGHLEGDKVLVRIAGVITSCLRAMDSAYRYGGEEFTVILPETTSKEALTVAQRIRAAVELETYTPNGGDAVSVTISIGLTQYVQNEKKSEFVHRADDAMYQSKENGRNKVTVLHADADKAAS